jgi:hypothetical protein
VYLVSQEENKRQNKAEDKTKTEERRGRTRGGKGREGGSGRGSGGVREGREEGSNKDKIPAEVFSSSILFGLEKRQRRDKDETTRQRKYREIT